MLVIHFVWVKARNKEMLTGLSEKEIYNNMFRYKLNYIALLYFLD